MVGRGGKYNTLGYSGGETLFSPVFPSAADDTNVYIGDNSAVNASGGSYIMYCFANDSSPSGLIRCGSYNSGGSSRAINLGWRPQWVMAKGVTTFGDWFIYDSARGVGAGANDQALQAHTSSTEMITDNIEFTDTGFTVTNSLNDSANNPDYIYIAIRE
jgi:hypothetical protein